jgi:Rha family phage regulatory protein
MRAGGFLLCNKNKISRRNKMELTIIKQNGGAYIDSREVAEYIGKQHAHLMRDIRGYIKVLEKFRGESIFGCTSFFVESNYIDAWNREKPCYLLSKSGCELVANKLIGEKGVLFTAAYVTKFNRMEQAEHEREVEALKKQAVTPRLAVFNKAIRTVMGGLNFAEASSDFVMKFLQDAYKPFGIEVADFGEQSRFYSASVIARALGVYSLYGNPHAHAVAAIIDKLDMNLGGHIEVAPYGMVGFSVRYDIAVAEAVEDWLIAHGKPLNIPHEGFEYHIVYDGDNSAFSDNGGGDYADEVINLDDDVDDEAKIAYLRSLTLDEMDALCAQYDDCGNCPYLGVCLDVSDLD